MLAQVIVMIEIIVINVLESLEDVFGVKRDRNVFNFLFIQLTICMANVKHG